MKKIAIVHGSLVIGGAEKVLLNMLRFIDYNKYDVTLWLRDNQGGMQNQIDPRVSVKYWGNYNQISYIKLLKNHFKNGRFLQIFNSIINRFLSRMFLNDYFRNLKYHLKSVQSLEKYDAVISYQSLSVECLMIQSFYLKGTKNIGWIHGECNHDSNDSSYSLFSSLYKKMDIIFCVSKSVKELFQKKHRYLKNKVQVMYNLQNYQEIINFSNEIIKIKKEKLILVTVGRISKEKGIDMIPFVAKNLKGQGLKFTWYIVGDGNLRSEIEKCINKLNLKNEIIILGYKDNPYPYIKRCSIYVQPSYTEGFCTTTFEAKILNKIVVLTDVPGMREQFNDKEAIFCEPNVESLTRGILVAVFNPPKISMVDEVYMDEFNKREINKLYQNI